MDQEERPMTVEELVSALAALMGHHQRMRDELLAPIRDQLAAVDAEMGPLIEAAKERVRAEVIARGESVKAGGLHAVILPGRVTWDSKALQGYAAGHPEILQFANVGDPSVSFKNAKP